MDRKLVCPYLLMYGSNIYKKYQPSFDEFISTVCIFWSYILNICHFFSSVRNATGCGAILLYTSSL